MSKTVNTTDDLVLKAAQKCPTAKDVLKELFPEVFVPKEHVIEFQSGVTIQATNGKFAPGVEKRTSNSNLKGLFLPQNIDVDSVGSRKVSWTIQRDQFGYDVLVGTFNA